MLSNPILRRILPHIIAVIVFVIASAAYFYPQLEGKVIQQGDIVSYRGASQEMKDFREKTGEHSYWTNSMFGGMPTYQIDSRQPNNFVQYVHKAARLFIDRPIGLFFSLMISFYVMMVFLGVNSWLSMVLAVSFGLATNNIVLYEAGHVTKIYAVGYLAPIVAGVILTFRKRYLAGGTLFTLGMALSFLANHPQMTYYMMLVLGIYGIIKLVEAIREKTLADFGKAIGIFALGLALAFGSSATKIFTTLEYSKDTMRGEPILEKTSTTPVSSSETKGLEWNYAMQWSNGWLDLLSAYIPGVVGGATLEPVSASSPVMKDPNWRRVAQNYNGKAPLYWGSLTSTSGPQYFGAIICFLFVLGILLVKGPLKWWLVAGVAFTFLMSMGKNFAVLNHLLFDYMPFFNKFRTPNSVLSVTTFMMPILGGLAITQLLKQKYNKVEAMRALKISAGIMGGLALFFALLGPSMFDFVGSRDANFMQANFNMDILKEARQSHMRADAFRTFIFVAIAAGLIWAFIQNKIKGTMLVLAIGLVSLVDLWGVGRRYLSPDEFVPASRYENQFKPRPADQQILQDKDPNYRVLDLSVDVFNSSFPSYFHKTVGGYHPAKLQRYQDIIDRHISKNNPKVLNMLNTRYIITQEGEVQRNPGALGNAWFVSKVNKVNTPNEEIDALGSADFNPGETAIVHSEYDSYLPATTFEKNGTISLTDYKPNHLTYSSNASSEQLAVFSEIWYGPDKGWNAYIDGTRVDHIRTDYLLRALKVPAGQHTIEFKFEPKTYAAITMISSLIIVLGLLALIGYGLMQWRKNLPAEPELQAESTSRPKPVKRTVSKRKKR